MNSVLLNLTLMTSLAVFHIVVIDCAHTEFNGKKKVLLATE